LFAYLSQSRDEDPSVASVGIVTAATSSPVAAVVAIAVGIIAAWLTTAA